MRNCAKNRLAFAFIALLCIQRATLAAVVLGEYDERRTATGTEVLHSHIDSIRSDMAAQPLDKVSSSSQLSLMLNMQSGVGIADMHWNSMIDCDKLLRQADFAIEAAKQRYADQVGQPDSATHDLSADLSRYLVAAPTVNAFTRSQLRLDRSDVSGYQRFRELSPLVDHCLPPIQLVSTNQHDEHHGRLLSAGTEMSLYIDMFAQNFTEAEEFIRARSTVATKASTYTGFEQVPQAVMRCTEAAKPRFVVVDTSIPPSRWRQLTPTLPRSLGKCLERASAEGALARASTELDLLLARVDPMPPLQSQPSILSGKTVSLSFNSESEQEAGASVEAAAEETKGLLGRINRAGAAAAVGAMLWQQTMLRDKQERLQLHQDGRGVQREREVGSPMISIEEVVVGAANNGILTLLRGDHDAAVKGTPADLMASALAHPATRLAARATAVLPGASHGGALVLRGLTPEQLPGGEKPGPVPQDSPIHLVAAVAGLCAEELEVWRTGSSTGGHDQLLDPSSSSYGSSSGSRSGGLSGTRLDRAWLGQAGARAMQPDAFISSWEPAPLRPREQWAPEHLTRALTRCIEINDNAACVAALSHPHMSIRGSACAAGGMPVFPGDPALALACAQEMWIKQSTYDFPLRQASVMPPLVTTRGRWPPMAGWTQGTPWTAAAAGGSFVEPGAPYQPSTGPLAPQRMPVPLWALGFPATWKDQVSPLPWTGQLQQDRWVIEHVYPGLRGGYFFEAGAVDGRELSNTWVLEKEYGWRGLLVEARREAEASLRHYRKGSSIEIALLGENDQEENVLHVAPMWNHDNTNTTAKFLPLAESGPEGTFHPSGWVSTGEVHRTRRLDRLLDEVGAPEFIHYFSLDVEGFEWDVLQTFPWETRRIGALSIEHVDSGNVHFVEEARISELLLRHGYVRERVLMQDSLWVHRTVAQQMQDREVESKRRRRGRARRPGFAGGSDWSSRGEDHDRYL